jgi:putative hemolysin
LAFEALGRRPAPGDEAGVADAQLRIEEVDGLRITRLRVTCST